MTKNSNHKAKKAKYRIGFKTMRKLNVRF